MGAFQRISRVIEDSDVLYSFTHTPSAVIAATITLACVVLIVFAPIVAPYNPYDLSSINLLDANIPPIGFEGASYEHLLGTDQQGRDILSTVIFGMRVSMMVAFGAVLFSGFLGVTLGLISGYFGGAIDAFIMRAADIQLTFPAILIALIVDGVARAIVSPDLHDAFAIYIIIISIGLSYWVQFARVVRGMTMVEKEREYVLAARVMGVSSLSIMVRHILINIIEPVFAIGTISFGVAIIVEATLSFLGVGLPPTEPSLGTLIRTGNDYLFSGSWWMPIIPGLALVTLVYAVNVLGDWMREAFNPKLH